MIVKACAALFHQIFIFSEGKTEIQKFEHLEKEKCFSDEIKNIFHSF